MVNTTLKAVYVDISTTFSTAASRPTVPTVPATGSISGHLFYPGSFIPALRVVSIDAANTAVYKYIFTLQNTSHYTILGLPTTVYQAVSNRKNDPTLVRRVYPGGATRLGIRVHRSRIH